jgi:hypothetical protein
LSTDSWLSAAVLARLKGQASHRQESRYSDDIPKLGEDPDDVIDPDDLTKTKPSGCALLLPPPAMGEAWWTALVLGREKDAVAPQDALLALAHVAYRLGYARVDAGLSHNDITLEGLHEAICERYGNAGWRAFTACWQEAAGIKQPQRKDTRSPADITDRIPARPKDHGVLSAEPLVPLPPTAFQMETGLHQALPEMPERVAAFLLHVPRDPPAWRYQETAGEQAYREFMTEQGAWCG